MGAFLSVKCPPHRQNIVNDDVEGCSKPIQLIFQSAGNTLFSRLKTKSPRWELNPQPQHYECVSTYFAVSITEPFFVSVSSKKPTFLGSNDPVIVCHFLSLSSRDTSFCPHKHRNFSRKHRSNIVTISSPTICKSIKFTSIFHERLLCFFRWKPDLNVQLDRLSDRAPILFRYSITDVCL